MARRGQAIRPSAAAAEPISKDEIPIAERLVSKGLNPEQLFGRLEIQEIIKDHIDELAPIRVRLAQSAGVQHQRDREDAEGVRRDFKREAVAGAT